MRKEFRKPEELKEEFTSEKAKDEKFEKIIHNAYFFGQFMMLHTLLKMKNSMGNEALFSFMKKKYKDIGIGNQHFINQAEKTDHLIKKYYEDTMATKF